MDKVLFGSIVGATAFFVGHWINLYMKRINNGKAFFPYQKVVIPVVTLIINKFNIFILLIIWKII